MAVPISCRITGSAPDGGRCEDAVVHGLLRHPGPKRLPGHLLDGGARTAGDQVTDRRRAGSGREDALHAARFPVVIRTLDPGLGSVRPVAKPIPYI